MILRRPYAFLIKHFRLIHLIMFILMAYITYRANAILSFFIDYIEANGNIEVIASNYLSPLIFVSAILIIAMSIVIYFLMRYKKKPRLFYIIIVVVSIISCILFIYLYGNIKSLEVNVMSGREIRLFRDISRFNFWILFVMCIPIIIRGLGFDIKKFNFSKDLKELKLEEQDSEEVEVNVDLSSEGVATAGRKTLRELKYYYLENKLFINIILGVVILILIIVFPVNMLVINRDLNEKEILGTSNFNMRVDDSYISARKRISKNNSYIILKVSFEGKTSKYKLDLDEFVLEGKNKKYIPSLKYYYYFTDIGIGYRENILSSGEYKDYILIYNIDNIDSKSGFVLHYLGNNKKIKLKPETLD